MLVGKLRQQLSVPRLGNPSTDPDGSLLTGDVLSAMAAAAESTAQQTPLLQLLVTWQRHWKPKRGCWLFSLGCFRQGPKPEIDTRQDSIQTGKKPLDDCCYRTHCTHTLTHTHTPTTQQKTRERKSIIAGHSVCARLQTDLITSPSPRMDSVLSEFDGKS